jgi:hypothetical protein
MITRPVLTKPRRSLVQEGLLELRKSTISCCVFMRQGRAAGNAAALGTLPPVLPLTVLPAAAAAVLLPIRAAAVAGLAPGDPGVTPVALAAVTG